MYSCLLVADHPKPLGNRSRIKYPPFVFSNIVDLEDTTFQLDIRVTILEENGGSDSNSSVAELEVRVETLKGTAADHETRITLTEENIQGKPKANEITLKIT